MPLTLPKLLRLLSSRLVATSVLLPDLHVHQNHLMMPPMQRPATRDIGSEPQSNVQAQPANAASPSACKLQLLVQVGNVALRALARACAYGLMCHSKRRCGSILKSSTPVVCSTAQVHLHARHWVHALHAHAHRGRSDGHTARNQAELGRCRAGQRIALHFRAGHCTSLALLCAMQEKKGHHARECMDASTAEIACTPPIPPTSVAAACMLRCTESVTDQWSARASSDAC